MCDNVFCNDSDTADVGEDCESVSVNTQLGQDVSFHEQRKPTVTQRNCTRSQAKNVLFLKKTSLTSSVVDVRNLAVPVNAKSSPKVLGVLWRFGEIVKMATRANETCLRNMVGCTQTISNFLLQSCCLAITTQRLN